MFRKLCVSTLFFCKAKLISWANGYGWFCKLYLPRWHCYDTINFMKWIIGRIMLICDKFIKNIGKSHKLIKHKRNISILQFLFSAHNDFNFFYWLFLNWKVSKCLIDKQHNCTKHYDLSLKNSDRGTSR